MTSKLLHTRPPVLYRWIRRRRSFAFAVFLVCGLVVLPLGVVGGVKVSDMVKTNNALAASRAMLPEHDVADVMSESERIQYAGTLSGLVIEDRQTIYQLISQDFLIMFNEPDLRRREGYTESWQYQAPSCVLDVYFTHGGTGKDTVVHYEIRQRKIAAYGYDNQADANIVETSCLQEIYDQRSV